jgi:hypothetical protein
MVGSGSPPGFGQRGGNDSRDNFTFLDFVVVYHGIYLGTERKRFLAAWLVTRDQHMGKAGCHPAGWGYGKGLDRDCLELRLYNQERGRNGFLLSSCLRGPPSHTGTIITSLSSLVDYGVESVGKL